MSLIGRISARSPRVPRRLSTGFYTAHSAVIPQNIRRFSTRFAHLFHQRFRYAFGGRFPQPFRTDSGEKMGENRAVIQNLWKSRKTISARRARPKSSTRRGKNAHKLWHVEHSDFLHPARRRRIFGDTGRIGLDGASWASAARCNRRSCVFAQDDREGDGVSSRPSPRLRRRNRRRRSSR